MTDKEKQIKNSVIYIITVAVSSLAPLVSLAVFTRILTTEDYGALALAQIYALFACSVANLGLNLVYERSFFQYRQPREASDLFYSVLLFTLVSLIASALLTYFFKESLARWIVGDLKFGRLLFWTFCSTAIISLKGYFLTYLRNSEKAKRFAQYTIAESFLWLLCAFVFVALLRTGVIGLVWAQLLSNAAILGILVSRFSGFLPFSFNGSLLKSSLRISTPITPRLFIGVANSHFDKYMISLLATIGGVGLYNVAQKIASAIFTFMTAMENVFTPRIYQKMFEANGTKEDTVGSYITPFAYICIFPALIVALFAPELVRIMTAAPFHGAAPIVTLFCLYYGFLFFGKLTGPRFLFAKKTHVISLLSVVTITINIALNIPFIRHWGVEGAAWAALLSGLLSGGINLALAQRYYPIRWEYGKMGAIYFLLFGPSLLLLGLQNAATDYSLCLTVKLASLLGYLLLGVRLKLLTRENFSLIKEILPRRFATVPNAT